MKTRPRPATGTAADHSLQWRQQWPLLLVLLLAGGLSSATGTMVAPVFPEAIAQFQVTPQWAGLLVSTHTLTLALASPTLGLLANRIGGVRMLVASLLAYAGFGILGGLAQGFWGMLLCRALTGAAGGGIAASGIGLISTLYGGEARSRLMGYAASALSVATVVFPLLGGWLGLYGWRWAFGLYGLGLPVAIAAGSVLPRSATATGKTVDLSSGRGLSTTLMRPRTLLLLLALAVASALFYVVVVYAPLHLKAAIQASSLLNGSVLAARAVGAALISAIGAHRLSQRLGKGRAISVGFWLMAVSLATIPLLTLPPLILLAALVFGLGFGIVMPNFYNALADLSPLSQRAGVLAIGTGCASLGQFASPLCFGALWQLSGARVFYVAAGIAAIISILDWLRRR